ncbi:MepB family protein [Flavobacterium agrisoli]|uniref:MepB family protein n=1 Tax=Flavobacterium agrisoli TaxID=2793066 RepID=A0A934PJR3_9FLAO|nr:MepB family protein [Flavobacterium agrisoli]MBK0368213.1 MepB family protein [Flavobacterium agrisoli]
MNLQEYIPHEIILALQKQFACSDSFDYQQLVIETESKEYHACRFYLKKHLIVFRKAKITPTKIGQFVTLYKRNSDKKIAPFTISDAIDYVVIWVSNEFQEGYFKFSKSILVEKGIFSTANREGKRAFRIYPPWDIAKNKQAVSSQKWQLNYFFEI